MRDPHTRTLSWTEIAPPSALVVLAAYLVLSIQPLIRWSSPMDDMPPQSAH